MTCTTTDNRDFFPDGRDRRAAFTLVEMMVAMAVTLLLMLALARAFAFVGQNIRDSRGDVKLSNELRDITGRLTEELESMTVSLTPNSGERDQLGYFLYHEGPVTDVTSSIMGIETTAEGEILLDHSRYGDFDDYIAFTAVATGDNWFTGKVPRFLLDQKTAEINADMANPNRDPTVDPYDPSDFANPNEPNKRPWDPLVIRSKYAEIIYFASPEYDVSSLPASPRYSDTDGKFDFGSGEAVENGLPDRMRLHRRVLLIRPDLNLRTGNLRQLNWDRNFNGVEFMRADAWPVAGAATVRANANRNDGWLYGMANAHQQCDLSLRRVLGSDGLPTEAVAANSLADLSEPHNRFAHVRVPGPVLGLSSSVTSMPVLALGTPATILQATAVDGTRMAPPTSASGTTSPVVTPSELSGFLRPEFVLGNNLTHLNSSSDAWGLERIGEDLIANELIGFDVKIYDPQAASITAPSGLVITPNDPGYREALYDFITENRPANRLVRGNFVDLAFPALAGGSLRGWGRMSRDRMTAGGTEGVAHSVLITPFSGVVAAGTSRTSYLPSLYRSGKILTNGNTIRLFQPTFDTFTSAYERDGFIQGYERSGSSLPRNLVGGAGSGSRWTTSTDATYVDLGTNGLDDNGSYDGDDVDERETLAPFMTPASAIKVTVRLENLANRQLRQSSVVHRSGF